MVTMQSPLGGFEFIPRDFAKMPRNQSPTVATKVAQLRGTTIHYSGGKIAAPYRHYPIEEADEILVAQAIRNHNARPGFSDVGYQVLIGRSGIVWEGRGLQWCNAANGALRPGIEAQYPPGTKTTNAYWQSIFLCVGIDEGYTDATPAQWEAARRVVAYINDRFNIANPWVNGHRDVRQTLCPGDTLLARPLTELLEPGNEDDMVSARVVIIGDPNFTQFHISGGKVRHIPDVPTSEADAPLSGPDIKSLDRRALKLYEFAPAGGPFPRGFSPSDFAKP